MVSLSVLRRVTRWLPVAAAALVLFGLVATWGRTIVAGDGPEYLSMLESWFRHASADQRPDDVAAMARWLRPMPERAHSGFFVTADGRWYSYHFWLYPLLAVPFKGALRLLRGDELEAFRWFNIALYVGATVAALRARTLPRARLALFVVLASVGPILWYLRWPHADVLVWSAATLGVLAFDARRYDFAAAAFAIGAMQSQPLVVFAVCAVGVALVERRRAAVSALVTLLAAIPPLFFWWHFGRVNLMSDAGLLDARLIGWRRFVGLACDPEMGLLFHAPATLLLGSGGLAAALWRRAWRPVALGSCAFVVMALYGSTVNWNAGSCGLLRYGLYVVPIFAWLGARALPRSPLATTVAVLSVVVQVAHVPSRIGADDSVFHGSAARWILSNAPSVYDPIPEAFVERTLGRATDAPWLPLPLPVGFDDGRGNVRKLLVDDDTLELLPRAYDVEPSYLHRIEASRGGGLRYYEPPVGSVRVRAGDVVMPLRTTLGDHVELGEGWLAVHHDPDRDWVCARRHATFRVSPSEGRVLSIRMWPATDLFGHAVHWTLRQGGRVLEDRLVFDRIAREYEAPGAETFEVDTSEEIFWGDEGSPVSFCADTLAWRSGRLARAW